MITAHNIGYMGQLGNQMFQYATLIGVAKKTGFEPVLPAKNVNKKAVEVNSEGKKIEYGLSIPECFKIPIRMIDDIELSKLKHSYNEPYHQFCGNIFNISDDTTIVGFFETEKYFEHARKTVLGHFTFKDEIKKIAEDRFKSITKGKINVCLHIRHHTQYNVGIVHHPYIPLNFYHAAIKMFPEDSHDIILFTDRSVPEEQFLYKNIINSGWQCNYDRPDFIDLCMMSMCDHHIIANSSFSWWGAWLANKPDQIIIAPKIWFGPGLAHKNTDDIIPQRWIKI
jgi:hypothetical protein